MHQVEIILVQISHKISLPWAVKNVHISWYKDSSIWLCLIFFFANIIKHTHVCVLLWTRQKTISFGNIVNFRIIWHKVPCVVDLSLYFHYQVSYVTVARTVTMTIAMFRWCLIHVTQRGRCIRFGEHGLVC